MIMKAWSRKCGADCAAELKPPFIFFCLLVLVLHHWIMTLSSYSFVQRSNTLDSPFSYVPSYFFFFFLVGSC